jgi:hypothetical protein
MLPRAAVLCVAGALLASHAFAAVTVSDGTFLDANWNLTQFLAGSGGSVTGGQVLSGGNPGAYRNVTDALTGGSPGLVLGTSIYTPFTYSPGVSGAIATLNYTEDAACTAGCFGQGQSTGPALLQGGKLYVLGSSSVITGPGAAWTTHALNNLTALDFGRVVVTPTSYFDNTQRPDFSANGAPIQFGYFRANSTASVAYTLAAGIDNWQISIAPLTPVPTLGAMELALLTIALGLLGLSFVRRRG